MAETKNKPADEPTNPSNDAGQEQTPEEAAPQAQRVAELEAQLAQAQDDKAAAEKAAEEARAETEAAKKAAEDAGSAALAVDAKAVAEEERVDIELTTVFTTNGVAYGEPEEDDEEGNPIYHTVSVPKSMADDLKRRQREYENSKRALVSARRFGKFSPNV